ncbi:MAG: FlgD immunoglobulin-like domain containing protein [Actinomycetota bacterium]
MQRFLTAATLVALLVATAAAFAITERLKLTKSALMPGTKVSKVFSPTCGCARAKANVVLVIRKRDTVDVSILDAHQREVTSLVSGITLKRGPVRVRWDGKTDTGVRAPDGAYRVKVHFATQHQTIVLPNRILLDTQPPQVVSVTQSRQQFSPDGDKQADFVRIAYVLSKQAHLTLFLDGKRILETYRHPARGSTTWRGKLPDGSVLPAGTYTLQVGALDLAGNSTPPAERLRVRVEIRYIQLAAKRIVARAGKPFAIGVSTDAAKYHWQLGTRKGRNGGALLQLQAPTSPGLYTLTVSERGHVSRAHVVVKP